MQLDIIVFELGQLNYELVSGSYGTSTDQSGNLMHIGDHILPIHTSYLNYCARPTSPTVCVASYLSTI